MCKKFQIIEIRNYNEVKLTGKIKYEKYSDRTNVYFEITRTFMNYNASFLECLKARTLLPTKTETYWCNERSLRIIETPEEFIYTCGD